MIECRVTDCGNSPWIQAYRAHRGVRAHQKLPGDQLLQQNRARQGRPGAHGKQIGEISCTAMAVAACEISSSPFTRRIESSSTPMCFVSMHLVNDNPLYM